MKHLGPRRPLSVDLRAIFLSLELSRSSWVITSLSPGAGGLATQATKPGELLVELAERGVKVAEYARRQE